jgi:hypothetical protein
MTYGKLRVDTITYDDSGTDVDVAVSALAGAGSVAPVNNPTFTGTVTIPAGANITNYAKTNVANTFSSLATFNSGVTIDGPYRQAVEALSGTSVNLATGNYFTKTISSNTTFTFTNAPSSGTVASFVLELTHSSGTVTWPGSVKWSADTAPELTAGTTHLFVFITDDGGSRYRGAALVDFVN